MVKNSASGVQHPPARHRQHPVGAFHQGGAVCDDDGLLRLMPTHIIFLKGNVGWSALRRRSGCEKTWIEMTPIVQDLDGVRELLVEDVGPVCGAFGNKVSQRALVKP